MELKQIKELKRGELFRVYSKTKGLGRAVYVRDEYDRSEKKFLVHKYYDINEWRYLKPTQLVCDAFEF